MGAYKLIALDLDGTLLNDEHKVSDENKFWINKAVEAGHMVAICTGRSVDHVIDLVDELQLKSSFVTVNGSEIWESPNVVINRHYIEAKIIAELRELALEYEIPFGAYSIGRLYTKTSWPEQTDSKLWMKFRFNTRDDEKRPIIIEAIQKYNLEMTGSDASNIELNPRGISKASGIQELCQFHGVKMSEVISMGDSFNDLALIRQAGLGVAMGNAHDVVKRAAKMVTATNLENGVAKVIQEYLLK